jgi:hypothetical protein
MSKGPDDREESQWILLFCLVLQDQSDTTKKTKFGELRRREKGVKPTWEISYRKQ